MSRAIFRTTGLLAELCERKTSRSGPRNPLGDGPPVFMEWALILQLRRKRAYTISQFIAVQSPRVLKWVIDSYHTPISPIELEGTTGIVDAMRGEAPPVHSAIASHPRTGNSSPSRLSNSRGSRSVTISATLPHSCRRSPAL